MKKQKRCGATVEEFKKKLFKSFNTAQTQDSAEQLKQPSKEKSGRTLTFPASSGYIFL